MYHLSKIAGAAALMASSHGLPRVPTFDALQTFDQATIDSTGAFLIGELERLDQTLHAPLYSVSWGRDIDLREDVTIADEVSSWTNSSFAAAGGVQSGGKAWISKDANQITGIALDIGKSAQPLTLWGMETKWTIPELESAMKLGRPVDSQKYEGMKIKYQMDVDEQVYIGDSPLSLTGMVNNAGVTPTNVPNGVGGSPLWSQKTPDEIVADVNSIISTTWAAAGYAVIPDQIRVAPSNFTYLVTQKVSNAGNVSILKYIQDNNILKNTTGRDLNILPLKWLVGMGAGGTQGVDGAHNRMLAYAKDKQYIRFPMTLLSRTPIEYRGIYQVTTYYGRLGQVEIVYPETVNYYDGM